MSRSNIISTSLSMSNAQLVEFSKFIKGEETFGVLTIKVADVPMSTHLHIIDSATDISGSMQYICSDGKSKMQHASHVLKNMANAIVNNNAPVLMASYGFDNKTDEIFSDTVINSENIAEIRKKFDKLQPRNGTNIHQSLVCTKTRVENRDQNIKQTCILLTDGLINDGIRDYREMKCHLSNKCKNIFIGLGGDHDDIGLQDLASNQLGDEYFYIQEIEKAGFVFGQILHEIFYTALSHISINVTNGEIYNYNTGEWSSELKVYALTGEANKTYHLRSLTSNDISVCISGCIGDENEPSIIEDDITPIPDLMSADNIIEANNLALHVIRQLVLELLYQAHKYSMYKTGIHDTIRSNIKELLANIKKYITENALDASDEYLTLCDDLSITLQTFDNYKAAMYSGSRQTSQGRQTSYNITQIEPDHYTYIGEAPSKAPTLNRAYTTDRQYNVMRSCSHSRDDGQHDKDEREQAELLEIAQILIDMRAGGEAGVAKDAANINKLISEPTPEFNISQFQ